jgi:hypothetical protein
MAKSYFAILGISSGATGDEIRSAYRRLAGEMPVSVSFPPGITNDHAVMMPLDGFGIRNVHLTVLFRPTGSNSF